MVVNSCLDLFTCNSSSQQPHEIVTILILTVQVGKLRHRGVKKFNSPPQPLNSGTQVLPRLLGPQYLCSKPLHLLPLKVAKRPESK